MKKFKKLIIAVTTSALLLPVVACSNNDDSATQLVPDQMRELDVQDANVANQVAYAIELEVNGADDYKYLIDAVTGEILYKLHDADDTDDQKDSEKLKEANQARLTVDEVLALVLAKENLTREQLEDLEIELDQENGKLYYEIEFDANNFEYDYEIDAYTGEILKYKKIYDEDDAGFYVDHDDNDDDDDDDDDDYVATTTTPAAPVQTTAAPTPAPTTQRSQISSQEALNIALRHAGLSAGQIYEQEIELDSDDGRLNYEIEFKAGNFEYEYDIDAYTGQIISFEKDADD